MFGIPLCAVFNLCLATLAESATNTTEATQQFGNVYNFWSKAASTGAGIDLTRGAAGPTFSIKTTGSSSKSPITVAPNQTALVIIDMQST